MSTPRYKPFTYTSIFVEPGKPTLKSERTVYCTSIKDMRRKVWSWDDMPGPRDGRYHYHETPEQAFNNDDSDGVPIHDIPGLSFIHTGPAMGQGFLAMELKDKLGIGSRMYLHGY